MPEPPSGGELSVRLRRKAEDALARFCDNAVPAVRRASSRLSYRIEGAAAILYEARKTTDGKGGWRTLPVVRFRYAQSTRDWHVERLDEKGAWHRAIQVRPARRLGKLLRAYSRASGDIFWG